MNLFSKRKVIQCAVSLFLCIFAGFLIFDQEGYIAVKNTENGTVYRTEFRTELLPASDTQMLSDGIYCENLQEAARVLENFCS